MPKKTIAVLDPKNVYLSHCTWERALGMLKSGRAVRLNATTVRLTQTKKERQDFKHRIIEDSRRICYICGRRIPYNETATIDHVIPRSRDGRADIFSNMRCCCTRCNNDKSNMTISEYVGKILQNRVEYDYISNAQLQRLVKFADIYEQSFYVTVHAHTYLEKKGKRRKRGGKK